MWWVHSPEGIPLMSIYSQAKAPLCFFSNVTRHSSSLTLRLGFIFNVFPSLISTGILFEFLITRIVSALLNRVSSVSYSCSSSFKVVFNIWYACLVTNIGSLIKLQIVSSSVSFLKVRALPIFSNGSVPFFSSKSIHNGVSKYELGRAGGYKVNFFISVPL